MKIFVIFTGGTIGSATKDGWITPDSDTKYILLDEYKKHFGSSVEFETETPYTILSENLSGDCLTKLIDCLLKNADKDYDGIIVAHGTDTLQYSAAATEYCLGSETKPVVFVSANYPLENPDTNGHINFMGAVEFIKSGIGKGVFVSYSNDLKTVHLHSATRLLRHPEWDHRLYSLGGAYANYSDGKIEKSPHFYKPNIPPLGKVNFLNNPQILNISVSPFENYNYDLSGIKAVLLSPYHSGTLNTGSESFKSFCKKAKEQGIPIFLTGVAKGAEYQSMQVYNDLSINVLHGETAISSAVKLWIALSLKKDIFNFVLNK